MTSGASWAGGGRLPGVRAMCGSQVMVDGWRDGSAWWPLGNQQRGEGEGRGGGTAGWHASPCLGSSPSPVLPHLAQRNLVSGRLMQLYCNTQAAHKEKIGSATRWRRSRVCGLFLEDGRCTGEAVLLGKCPPCCYCTARAPPKWTEELAE